MWTESICEMGSRDGIRVDWETKKKKAETQILNLEIRIGVRILCVSKCIILDPCMLIELLNNSNIHHFDLINKISGKILNYNL